MRWVPRIGRLNPAREAVPVPESARQKENCFSCRPGSRPDSSACDGGSIRLTRSAASVGTILRRDELSEVATHLCAHERNRCKRQPSKHEGGSRRFQAIWSRGRRLARAPHRGILREAIYSDQRNQANCYSRCASGRIVLRGRAIDVGHRGARGRCSADLAEASESTPPIWLAPQLCSRVNFLCRNRWCESLK